VKPDKTDEFKKLNRGLAKKEPFLVREIFCGDAIRRK